MAYAMHGILDFHVVLWWWFEIPCLYIIGANIISEQCELGLMKFLEALTVKSCVSSMKACRSHAHFDA